MNWRIEFARALQQNVALFVSHYLHCLADLLHRHQTGEDFHCNLALIVSNHEDARRLARVPPRPRFPLPATTSRPPPRPKVEAARNSPSSPKTSIDLIVLARYMQVLSPAASSTPTRAAIINVHHSVPACLHRRAPACHAAFARGVKLIGATSHYVTEELDEGPIIEQDVARVAQSDQLPDLIQKGRDLERMVLSRAVQWHLDHRILSYANKTVIFA